MFENINARLRMMWELDGDFTDEREQELMELELKQEGGEEDGTSTR